MPEPLTVSVWRGDAAGGAFQDFLVESTEGEVVLDVIHRIQATQANDLAVRWNCKAAKCGSCSAEINGRPTLMCDGRHRMRQHEVERVQEFRKCIECWLCQNVCHVIRDHEENKQVYAGPRFFIRYAELEMHPLDQGDRVPLLHDQMGLAYCNITKCCTEVCPEHIKITDNAIIPLKERTMSRYYDPIAKIGRIIRRRTRLRRGDSAQ